MKCPNCGAQVSKLSGETYTCEYCRSTYHAREFDPGWNENSESSGVTEIHHHYHDASDKLSTGLGCLCFFFFPLGWIIYFLYKDSSPKKARAAMIIALVMTVFMLIGIAAGGSGPGK